MQLAKASAKPLKNRGIPQIRQDVRHEFHMMKAVSAFTTKTTGGTS
jgi:hypothetical protein